MHPHRLSSLPQPLPLPQPHYHQSIQPPLHYTGQYASAGPRHSSSVSQLLSLLSSSGYLNGSASASTAPDVPGPLNLPITVPSHSLYGSVHPYQLASPPVVQSPYPFLPPHAGFPLSMPLQIHSAHPALNSAYSHLPAPMALNSFNVAPAVAVPRPVGFQPLGAIVTARAEQQPQPRPAIVLASQKRVSSEISSSAPGSSAPVQSESFPSAKKARPVTVDSNARTPDSASVGCSESEPNSELPISPPSSSLPSPVSSPPAAFALEQTKRNRRASANLPVAVLELRLPSLALRPLQCTTASHSAMVTLPVRFFLDGSVLLVTANDVCRLLNIRKENTSKSLKPIRTEDKKSLLVLCQSSNGVFSSRSLSLLTQDGARQLCQKSYHALSVPVERWIEQQMAMLRESEVFNRLQKQYEDNNQHLPGFLAVESSPGAEDMTAQLQSESSPFWVSTGEIPVGSASEQEAQRAFDRLSSLSSPSIRILARKSLFRRDFSVRMIKLKPETSEQEIAYKWIIETQEAKQSEEETSPIADASQAQVQEQKLEQEQDSAHCVDEPSIAHVTDL